VSELPPSPGETDEVDALYRRASARDASRPSESVRRAVLDHAAQLAVKRAAGKDAARSGTELRARRQSWWRPAAFGTLAAAALAGFLVIPQYLGPDVPISATSSPTSVTVPVPAAAPTLAAATSAEGRNRQAAQHATREPSVTGAPSAPAAQDSVQPAARSARSAASSTAALSYSPPSAVASVAQAARSTGPAVKLRQAAELGDVPALQTLLSEQPALDARDADGRTALMLATLHGRIEAVEALLSAGADPNAADLHGTTPLQAALAGDQPAIAAALRRAGAR
jgi:hypothetical protein